MLRFHEVNTYQLLISIVLTFKKKKHISDNLLQVLQSLNINCIMKSWQFLKVCCSYNDTQLNLKQKVITRHVKIYSGQQVRPTTAPKGPHSQPPEAIPGHNLLVFTAWETWSPCSKCGSVGMRGRSGICTVKLLPDGFGRQTMGILTLFQKGIPCRSALLPPALQTIPEIYQRKSEVMIAFCKVCAASR
jgi:hypothetical protein